LAAVVAGAECVIATDYNPATLDILAQSARLNFGSDADEDSDCSDEALRRRSALSTVLFDVTDLDTPLPPWPVTTLTALAAPSESEWVEMDCPCSDFDDGLTQKNSAISSSSNEGRGGASGVCDLLVCADLLYTPRTARALALRCAALLNKPAAASGEAVLPWRVLVGDCGRPGAAAFVNELQRLGLLAATSTGAKVASENECLAAFRMVAARTLVGERHVLIATEHRAAKALAVGVIELGPWV
jgi:predicted nicotinamide N-methyase